MFSINALEHRYDGKPVVSVPSWSAAEGEHWLLLGVSGSGKTTLLHIVAGLLRPSSGSVTVAGQDLSALSATGLDHFRGRHIGIVPQRLHLIQSLTVLDNLLLAQYLAGVKQDRSRVQEVLGSLGMAEKAGSLPPALSFGQAQRVALARAVINRPQLILADEPTSNLDDGHCLQVLDLLENQARSCSATLVIATHDRRIRERMVRQYRLTEDGERA